jgi:hypothetical protein
MENFHKINPKTSETTNEKENILTKNKKTTTTIIRCKTQTNEGISPFANGIDMPSVTRVAVKRPPTIETPMMLGLVTAPLIVRRVLSNEHNCDASIIVDSVKRAPVVL